MADELDRLERALRGQYDVETEIGAGGMATVYRAHDRKHDRRVALKVLRPEVSEVVAPKRFLAEIRTMANLQHPNIVPLFDSGEADGLLYFVMPLVEGESLRVRIQREGQLPVEEALRIVAELGEALGYAHARGIVHRDIKPANVLLSGGRALVADFGIALGGEREGQTKLTARGVSVGTLGYMSPEQAFGEEGVDRRADIYALGAILFEMLTGEPPYSGRTVQSVLAKQVAGAAPSVRALRPAVPPTVDAAIQRALASSPADRFGTMEEMIGALGSPSVAPAVASQEAMSLLVLPFANRSPDPDQEYLSDGLTEEIITDLSKIRALRVISRNSAMLLKGTTKSTRAIAHELGVSHVVSGSVRRAGDALRIVAELVDATTDSPVWSERYTGTVADVFDMQERVAHSIVEALRVELRPSEQRRLAARPIGDVRAYECYLRARQEMWRFSPDGPRRAVSLLEEGLRIVGENALLYATMGSAYIQYVNSMTRTDDEPLQQAERCVERCFTLSPGMPEAYVVRGMVAWFRGDWRAAYRDIQESLRRQGEDPEALIWSCCLYGYAGQFTAADEAAVALLKVDPLTPLHHIAAGLSPMMTGRFAEAREAIDKAYEADPNIMVATFYAYVLRQLGRTAEAVKMLRDTPSVMFQEWMVSMLIAGWEGRRSDVLDLARAEYAASARRIGIWSLWVAESHAQVDAEAEALDWMENAIDKGFIYPPFLAQHDGLLAKLRGKSGFEALVARATREWEDFSLEVAGVRRQSEGGEAVSWP